MRNVIISALISTLITMVLIFLIKKVAIQYNIPGLKTVAEGI